MEGSIIRTKRLILRPWHEADRAPWAQLNQDPRVMEYFPSTLTREESDAGFARVQAHFEKYGFGFWAVEIPKTSEFAGFIGIKWVNFEANFAPAVEIGWRLAHEHWGHGYATEGALASLEYAFKSLQLPEIVSFTATQNSRSRNVMTRIGMTHDSKSDFDHPQLPSGHRLMRHVLYRIPNPA